MNDLDLNVTLHYKGYDSKIFFSIEDKLYHGKIEEIPDLVNWECKFGNLPDLYSAFVVAVEDYLSYIKELLAE